MLRSRLRPIGKKKQAAIDAGEPVKRPRAPKTKPAITPLKTLRNKADRLARDHCKRNGFCQAGGYIGPDGSAIRCSDRLEWAHVKSRGHLALRHDPRNAACLCNRHHAYFTCNPEAWTAFMETIDPGVWDYLNSVLISRRDPRGKVPLVTVYERWIEFYQRMVRDAD